LVDQNDGLSGCDQHNSLPLTRAVVLYLECCALLPWRKLLNTVFITGKTIIKDKRARGNGKGGLEVDLSASLYRSREADNRRHAPQIQVNVTVEKASVTLEHIAIPWTSCQWDSQGPT
jgi:hypothetical protein